MTIPRCPRCNQRIIFKSADGKVRIRTRIIAFGPNGAEGVCKKCGSMVPLDIELGEALRTALAEPPPKLILRKTVDSPQGGS